MGRLRDRWGASVCIFSTFWLMRVFTHWLAVNANLLAFLVTVGVAFLLVCCLECTKCPVREKDELFKRREV